MNIKRIKEIIREGNFASSGMIRGIGAVTGESGSATGEPGMNTSWIDRTASEQEEHTQASQGLRDYHNDLHNEIEDNDLNPKNGSRRARVVVTQA